MVECFRSRQLTSAAWQTGPSMRGRPGPVFMTGDRVVAMRKISHRAPAWHTVARCRKDMLSMYPVIALIVLMLFTWIVAIWASCRESDEHHDEEKPEKRSDEHREDDR